MLQKLIQIWRLPDLRKSILFVLGMLVIYRLAAHITIPGVDTVALRKFFEGNEIFGLLNIFTGGGMQTFSVVMLGVAPYITSSIIFQLLAMIVPSLEEMSKEEDGRRKINQYTRLLAVPLALLQTFGAITLLQQSPRPVLAVLSLFDYFSILVTVTAGTIFLMWIGELISERKIGNGISLLIFAGIVEQLPALAAQTVAVFDFQQIFQFIVFVFLALITIVGVVIITEGQRNIAVSYAKRVRGNRMYGGSTSHLPLRVNMAGVIPIIFAISIILFPPMIAQFLKAAKSSLIQNIANGVIDIFQNQIFYDILYFVLVFGFTYFYTAVIFQPNRIAENLQKQGGFIPGIRPGGQTASYISYVVNRILFGGALFLGLIAVLPLLMRPLTGIEALTIGGTSLLIVVSVVIETLKQVDAQLTMREYEGL